MLRRFSLNFALFSMFLDGVITLTALFLAAELRPRLPLLPLLRPLNVVRLPDYGSG